MNAFDVGVEPSVVDDVPVREGDDTDLSDVLVFGVVTFALTSLVGLEFEPELFDDRDDVAAEDEDPAEKPPDGLALAELRTTCCDE